MVYREKWKKLADTKVKQNTEGLKSLQLSFTTQKLCIHYILKYRFLHKVLPSFISMSCPSCFQFFLLPCGFQEINAQRNLFPTCNSCRVSHSVAFSLDRTCLVNKSRCTLKQSREYWGSSTNGFWTTLPWAHASHGNLVLTGLQWSISCQLNNVFSLENAGTFLLS